VVGVRYKARPIFLFDPKRRLIKSTHAGYIENLYYNVGHHLVNIQNFAGAMWFMAPAFVPVKKSSSQMAKVIAFWDCAK
jgi:hypothetical protein